jgi:hypothetical protein
VDEHWKLKTQFKEKIMSNRKLVVALVVAVCIPLPVSAENWVDLTGADKLLELMSGAKPEIMLREGVVAKGEYFADGTAKIDAWGETFDRTWEVVGNEQVCYSSVTEINCYTFEQNLDVPGEYRVRHTETGELIVVRETGKDPGAFVSAAGTPGEGGLGSPTAEEIAAQLADPNTNLGTMNINFDYVAYDGDLPNANSQSAFRATFQPSLPYKLSPTTNLFVRPAIPVIFSQDVPNLNGGYDSEGVDLGDIGFDTLVLRTAPSVGAVFGAGIVGTLPTATDDALGLDQWLVGPELVGAIVRKWGVLGLLVTHQWDVAGEDDFDTSITSGQYFYVFNLKGGWQINGSPVFSYNHEADSDNDLSLPVALGVSKTMFLAGRPWKFGLQYWHYIESPDTFGPDWQVRFTVSPVVALPW